MKKILILNWRCPKNPISGGAEMVTLEHAKAWAKNGFDVTWLTGNYKDGKDYEKIDGVGIYRFGSPFSIYFLAPFLYWFKWNGNFDLIIDEFHGIPFLSPLWAWKSKKLAYVHEVAQEIWDEMFPFPINIVGKIYEKIYFYFYKEIPFLTGSNSTKQDLISYGISENNIEILPHGLFLKPVSTVPQKEKDLTLLYVSRLVRMKGIEDAIIIFSKVLKKAPNARFWIVGDGEESYIDRLHSLIKVLHLEKTVTFFGYVDETKKTELYQKAHFLLHTSVREGFGLVVTEANSQGTPALTYDSPGLRDVVKNGINGYTFQKEKYDLIADKCISLYNSSEYKKLAQSAINSSKKYDWDKITKQSLEKIKTILT